MKKYIIIIVITVAIGYFINYLFRIPYNYSDCIDKYIGDAKNDKASTLVNMACRNLTNNKAVKYSKCILKNIDNAKTEKSATIVDSNCRRK